MGDARGPISGGKGSAGENMFVIQCRNGEVSLKTEIFFIRVHFTGSLLTVVQRFKVAFIREIWLPVQLQETGRFVLYAGELACQH